LNAIDMKFFCRGIYDGAVAHVNQEEDARALFAAAGSTYNFSSAGRNSRSNYATKLFNGTKKLSGAFISSFPNPIDKVKFKTWLASYLDEDKLPATLGYYGIPSSVERSLIALARALADQMQLLIHCPEDQRDIVVQSYQQYLSSPSSDSADVKTLYDNDQCIVYTAMKDRRYTVDFDEEIAHTWELYNAGSQTWSDRSLSFCPDGGRHVKAIDGAVVVPRTPPGAYAKFTARLKGRGTEGEFPCHWIMVDAEGRNCFPDSTMFDIHIKVVNKQFLERGGRI